MKKAMRIILPILLAIAVIGCMIWYLFVYDRNFTRDMLLNQARYFERNGNHSAAAWFYDLAYSHSSQDEAVAIELAEQYKSIGNYTKAEYTLSNAIADGGTADLYIALCQTYVEQDKLLDAVNMLDNVTDAAIKAQLDAMRPAAPTTDPAPGFYSQYLSVTVSAESGTLYVTTDGQYPSTMDAPYSEPIPLTDGETTVYALAVADNGLVSPLSIYGYTIGGVVKEVTFSDAAFEAEIRAILDVNETQILYTNDLWPITSFTMPAEAKNYADLAWLPYLRCLTIDSGVSQELSNISALTNLMELNIYNMRPTQEDLAVFSSIATLERLTLANCGLSSIEGLSAHNSGNLPLIYLDLSNNTIRNIDVLASMSALEELNMQHNALTNLSALQGLNHLTKLDVSYNAITSIAPICSIVGLRWLDVSNNALVNLGAIDNLAVLTHFAASDNALTDVAQLGSCLELSEVILANNAITDITGLAPLSKLTHLDFANNQVTALPAFSKDCTLIVIIGSNNLLTSLEELKGLPQLNSVFMDYNEELSSVTPLASCPMLILVNVYGTSVTDVSALKAMDVVVNYDPTAG